MVPQLADIQKLDILQHRCDKLGPAYSNHFPLVKSKLKQSWLRVALLDKENRLDLSSPFILLTSSVKSIITCKFVNVVLQALLLVSRWQKIWRELLVTYEPSLFHLNFLFQWGVWIVSLLSQLEYTDLANQKFSWKRFIFHMELYTVFLKNYNQTANGNKIVWWRKTRSLFLS